MPMVLETSPVLPMSPPVVRSRENGALTLSMTFVGRPICPSKMVHSGVQDTESNQETAARGYAADSGGISEM